MFNLTISMVLMGVLSASGMHYLNSLEYDTQRVSQHYVEAAYQRFEFYDELIPGVVRWNENK